MAWALLMLATDTAGMSTLIGFSSNPGAMVALFLLGSVVAFLPVALAAAVAALPE